MRRRVLVLLILVGGLAILDRGLARSRAAGSPAPGAEWIWARGAEQRQVAPQTFLAVRDFQLERVPGEAVLLILVDERYLVSLNGRALGSGRYPGRTVPDRYPVTDLLRVGGNRIVVEASSERGAGGLLLSLTNDTGETVVRSDGSWRIFRHYRPGIVRGSTPIEEGEPAWSWRGTPVGRWGRLEAPRDRPRLDRVIRAESSSRARATGEVGPPGRERRRGPVEGRAHFDFGRETEGFLTVQLSGNVPTRALVFAGARPPRPGSDRPVAGLLPVPGSPFWQDAEPRRFRYVTLVGLTERARVRVLEPSPAVARSLRRPAPERVGVLGLIVPRLGSPLEDEVWRELEGFSSVAGSEEPEGR